MIFIIGLGRSGTSLLQSILNAHSKIAFLPETHFFRRYVITGKLDNRHKDEVIRILNTDTDFQRAKINALDLIPSVSSFKSKELFDNLGQLYLLKKEKSVLGDKDPRNLDYINKIQSLYPEAKFIHINRDPRDIISSRIKADWSSSYPFILHPLIVNAQYNNAIKAIKKLNTRNYFELQYEELIKDTEKTVQKICQFINVEFEKGMLDYTNSSQELVAESEMQWKKETFKPIIKNNFNKWETALTNNQIYIIQIICKSILKTSHYQTEKTRVSLWLTLCTPLLVMFSNLVSILYPLRTILKK